MWLISSNNRPPICFCLFPSCIMRRYGTPIFAPNEAVLYDSQIPERPERKYCVVCALQSSFSFVLAFFSRHARTVSPAAFLQGETDEFAARVPPVGKWHYRLLQILPQHADPRT